MTEVLDKTSNRIGAGENDLPCLIMCYKFITNCKKAVDSKNQPNNIMKITNERMPRLSNASTIKY